MGIKHTDDKYMEKLDVFEKNLKKFYQKGKYTYLREGDVPSYFHFFCFYLSQIAVTTYQRHNLGLGIFTMQGFERRNKESKTLLSKASTLNRNSPALLVNNIRRLQQLFVYS